MKRTTSITENQFEQLTKMMWQELLRATDGGPHLRSDRPKGPYPPPCGCLQPLRIGRVPFDGKDVLVLRQGSVKFVAAIRHYADP